MEKRNRQKEQELHNERLRFYTNIAHELRTPLTLIIGPLEDLKDNKGIPAAFRTKIQTIYRSAVQLLNLINQLMEFRKTETQNRQLTVGKGNLSNLITEIGLRYKELNQNEHVRINVKVEPVQENIYFDADIITIPGVRCHPLDPSNDPTCSPSIRDHGIACKTIFDCTVPYDQKKRFVRARFLEVDSKHWLDEE